MTKNDTTMRLIDADSLLALVKKNVPYIYHMLAPIVAITPTIDAEPVRHGRWEWRENWGAAFQDPPEILDAGWACSACGTDLLPYLQSHFPDIPSYTECASEENPTIERCPCCGAKMDGGAEV